MQGLWNEIIESLKGDTTVGRFSYSTAYFGISPEKKIHFYKGAAYGLNLLQKLADILPSKKLLFSDFVDRIFPKTEIELQKAIPKKLEALRILGSIDIPKAEYLFWLGFLVMIMDFKFNKDKWSYEMDVERFGGDQDKAIRIPPTDSEMLENQLKIFQGNWRPVFEKYLSSVKEDLDFLMGSLK